MNNSGQPLARFIKNKNIAPPQILVIHDDLDFPSGIAKFKFAGGDGGHNGLKSINISLGSRDYWRLRIGIGRPVRSSEVNSYVLRKPPPTEKKIYEEMSPLILAAITEFVRGNKSTASKISIHLPVS